MNSFNEIQKNAEDIINNISYKVRQLNDSIKKVEDTLIKVKENLNLTDEEFKGVKTALIEMLKRM